MQYTELADGIEVRFAVNHLGHVLLTDLHLPLFKFDYRIVNVSSSGYAGTPNNRELYDVDVDD